MLSGLGWHWRDLYELCGGIVRGDRWVVGLHTGGCSTFLFHSLQTAFLIHVSGLLRCVSW
jgi:hypothetical protein